MVLLKGLLACKVESAGRTDRVTESGGSAEDDNYSLVDCWERHLIPVD
jgi:hypothetical protein